MDIKKPAVCDRCNENRKVMCAYCMNSGEYVAKNYEDYKKLSNNQEKYSFDLALRVHEDIYYYVNSAHMPIKEYLNRLEEGRKKEMCPIKWGKKYIWKIYRIIKTFPDLINEQNRKLRFSAYNEIVNSKLTDYDKHSIRQHAEKNKLSVRAIREQIVKAKNKPKLKAKPRKFTCTTRSEVSTVVELMLDELNMGRDMLSDKGGEKFKIEIRIEAEKSQGGAKYEDTKS
jgi:hypothetical protein